MGKYLIVRGRGGRDAADGSSPLPKGKRILQHAIVVYLFNGRTELESFFIAIFLKVDGTSILSEFFPIGYGGNKAINYIDVPEQDHPIELLGENHGSVLSDFFESKRS